MSIAMIGTVLASTKWYYSVALLVSKLYYTPLLDKTVAQQPLINLTINRDFLQVATKVWRTFSVVKVKAYLPYFRSK